MEHKCLYCNKIFANKYTLQNHIDTAKICMKNRNDVNIKFQCKICQKNLASKQSMINHFEKCKIKKEREIEEMEREKNRKIEENEKKERELEEKREQEEKKIREEKERQEKKIREKKERQEKIENYEKYKSENKMLKEEIIRIEKDNKKYLDLIIKNYETQNEGLQKQIKDLHDHIERLETKAINKPTIIKPTINHNKISNVINNLIPLTNDYIKEQVNYLTLEHVKNGVNGYVQYALDYPLKDRIICTDYSRRKIKYKDEEGNVIDDPEMIKISQKLFEAIKDQNSYLVDEYIKELHYKYKIIAFEPNNEMDDNTSVDYERSLNILSKELFKLNNQKREIIEISEGSKNDTYHEFVKDICGKIIK